MLLDRDNSDTLLELCNKSVSVLSKFTYINATDASETNQHGDSEKKFVHSPVPCLWPCPTQIQALIDKNTLRESKCLIYPSDTTRKHRKINNFLFYIFYFVFIKILSYLSTRFVSFFCEIGFQQILSGYHG